MAPDDVGASEQLLRDLDRHTAGAFGRHAGHRELAARIDALPADDLAFVREWAELLGRSDHELAMHFLAHVPTAFSVLPRDGVQGWLDHAMQLFDNRGLGLAVEVLDNVEAFVGEYASRHVRCAFEDASGFLRHYVRGLGGRELRIATDPATYTDTESLYLPEQLAVFGEPEQNFTLYKLTAVHLWAQTWYGTWRFRVVERLLGDVDTDVLLPIFNRLECLRLDACLARDLPGLARELSLYGAEEDAAASALWDAWRARAAALLAPGASAEDSLALMRSFRDLPLPPLKHYQGEMLAGKVRDALFARIEREKAAFQRAMNEMRRNEQGQQAAGEDVEQRQVVEVQDGAEEQEDGAESAFQVVMNGETMRLPDHLKDLVGSILQDFGEIPPEHMEPVELGEYSEDLLPQSADGEADTELDARAEGIYTYREWDCVRQRFREDFCTLRELPVPAGDPGFVEATLDKHRGLMKAIKRSFEAVIAESRLQRRQADGDDIDLDALVEAWADRLRGREMSEHLYTRYRNQERNIAVMFMVDMSGSTLGWVNDAERESLVLLCEALQMLGDRYAIFGFSGRTNKRCEVYRIKDFDQGYDEDVRLRISGIRPKAYTRMGVAIRHLGHLLDRTHARTKLLITLSDGRPEDYGGYKGKYGIEDTRHALLELKQAGIHAFCITIDNEAQEYLPHMYGTANYTVIDEVQKLPYKVADIYRRLTT